MCGEVIGNIKIFIDGEETDVKQYHLGLVSISFRAHTPEELLQAVKEAGLTCIEWGSDVHAPKDDLENLENLVKLQASYGITCSSYGSYFKVGRDPLEELPDYIKAAKILGTDIIRLWCGGKNSEDYTEEEKEALFETCRQAAKIAEAEGVIFCMECHNNTYTNRKEGALELMKAVDSPAFRMYWQPNQFRTQEENIAYAELLSEYITHLHVFHWEGHERFPLRDGVEKWLPYLEKLEGDRALLLEFMPDDKLTSLGEEAKALAEIAERGK